MQDEFVKSGDDIVEWDLNVDVILKTGRSFSNSKLAPLLFKMAQNLGLRCVLVPAHWVLGPKHVSNPEY